MEASPHALALRPGTPVLVRNSLNLWSTGFQIAAWRNERCQVRRDSDGSVLPRLFSADDIRPA
jgi:hypothetical protein